MNMRIDKVYKTSKGMFWSLPDANKNRTKEYGSRPGDPVEYEPVREVSVLIGSDQQGVTKVFNLSEVEVK